MAIKEFNINKLLGRLKELGYTQGDLAKHLGITESSLSIRFSKKKKKNKSVFDDVEITSLCNFLKVEPNYFFS